MSGFTDAELLACRIQLFRFCKGLCRGTYPAEDLLQDTLSKAIRHRQSYEKQEGKELISWLYTIARNHLSSIRRKKTNQEISLDDEVYDSWLPSQEANQDHYMDLLDTNTAFKSLQPQQQQTLLALLKYQHWDTAADALGINRGTFKSRTNRARACLKKALNAPPTH